MLGVTYHFRTGCLDTDASLHVFCLQVSLVLIACPRWNPMELTAVLERDSWHASCTIKTGIGCEGRDECRNPSDAAAKLMMLH